MSKIKCNKCGSDIKIKTIFLERAGCENCGNSIDFTKMEQLDGLRQALMLGTAAVVGLVLLVLILGSGMSLGELSTIFSEISARGAGLLLIVACIIVLIVGTLERIIGCGIYEQWRKREEELERIAKQKRAEDAQNSLNNEQ